MTDKSASLILDALSRAAAIPEGVPLHGGKATPGLFAATSSGREAARQCKDEGLLRVVRTQTNGKAIQEICAVTEKGLDYLLKQVSPRRVLEEFVRVLEQRRSEWDEIATVARQTQLGFDALRASAEKVLQQVQQKVSTSMGEEASDAWPSLVLSHLARRQETGVTGDCPLPQLYQTARQTSPTLTIGRFHDGLRRLHEQKQIYLHPWTGPLYDIPEPALALLVGHEVVYYASTRN